MEEMLNMKRNLARPTPTRLLVLLKSWRKLPAQIDGVITRLNKIFFLGFRPTTTTTTAHMDGATALELSSIVGTVKKKIKNFAGSHLN